MTNNRPCEVCGKNDLPCVVHSSSLGAMSFNYCVICSPMGAEPTISPEMAETLGFPKVISYNDNDDMYYDSSDNHLKIKTGSGKSFDTRDEYVKYHKETK